MNNIEQLYITCMGLKAISGTNNKKDFLKAHKDNEDFIALLKFLLNPRIVTGIDKAKLSKKVPAVRGFIGSLNNLYTYLEQNNTGKDADVAMCQGFMEGNFSPEFIASIITKSLKLSVDTKLCNTVYGKDFIPVHEVQQGSPRDKLRLKNSEIFFLTQKLNGVRCTYVNGELISRQGVPFTGLEHIVNELMKLEIALGKPTVFDGELIRKNPEGLSDNANFTLGTGIINANEGDKSCIELVLFDLLSFEEFKTGKSKEKYSVRRKILDSCTSMPMQSVRIVPVEYQGADSTKIDEFLTYADSQGWEGLMLNKDVPYYCKRHTGLIKIKTFKFSDLKIVGYEEGTAKYEGMLGAVIVDYKGNTVNVGSGFTDEQRVEYWAMRYELIGKIAEVKYKEETTDKKSGLKSLQFPVFVQLREDKTEPSLES